MQKLKLKKGGSVPACVKKYAKSSGKSVSTLNKVYKRGQGAYFSSGSRPGQSSHSWGCGRVRSFATGKGGARKADADLLGKKKKKKMSHGGEHKFDPKKADLNKDGKLSSYERKRGRAVAANMSRGGQFKQSKHKGCGAVMNNRRKTTKFR